MTWLSSRISSHTDASLLALTMTLRIISTVPLAASTDALLPVQEKQSTDVAYRTDTGETQFHGHRVTIHVSTT